MRMATIKVEAITPQMNNRMELFLGIRTSKGMISIPFRFDDQGSASANEKYAFDELKVFLQEAQQALEALGRQ
jgi:hypothetical protein